MTLTLLVMAAGMGSRYGGLKQLDGVGPNGETILDYSVHDALRAGFANLVFVVREHFADVFRERLGRKYESEYPVAYLRQELHSATGEFPVPANREKPWGTGHAVLIARDFVHGPFAVINADDYYGPTSFRIIGDFLRASARAPDPDYAMVGFTLRNTLSESGRVARGICTHDGQMHLTRIVERTNIERAGKGARYFDSEGHAKPLSGDEIASMNLWGFHPTVFPRLETQFQRFLSERAIDPRAEFFISDEVGTMISKGIARVKVLPTPDSWFGVTYREDKEIAVATIRRLIREGLYPELL